VFGARKFRIFWLAAAAVRFVALLLALELSGFVHAAQDIALGLADVGHQERDCEQEGKSCPPDCANCHCARTGVVEPPKHDWALSLVLPRDYRRLDLAHDSRTPKHPAPSSLYRPPKPAAG
jgi:hypothetical protein